MIPFQSAVVEMERYYDARRSTQRRGQAYFNWLYDYNQRAATDLTGSKRDPFYDDANIGPFLALIAVMDIWA
jgi:hypothetical protein